MAPHLDLNRLNSEQRRAVLHDGAHLLMLAGAGTGKTTALTYRIAHLHRERGVSVNRILALTFTNKAAREMRERTAKLCALNPRQLDMGTFHAMCGRLLRQYAERVGLNARFVIYDHDDQLQLLRRVMTELNIATQSVSPRALQLRIEQWKNQGLTAHKATCAEYDMIGHQALKAYHAYERQLLEANAVDFGNMLLHVLTLLRKDVDIRTACQKTWQHILVDEYQDTNVVQYKLLRALVGEGQHLTVVGDDDQSIYRWRGADIGNILRFERDFEGAEVIRLERNYRSTQTILRAANIVIANNSARKGKTLHTENEEGTPLTLRLFASEREEGEAVGDMAATYLSEGVSPSEIAVLYRTNAQSRPIEDALRRRAINYVVFGGVRFYDRKEVKDALAYLRVVANPHSTIDFLRIVNAPARGIGKTTLQRLSDVARAARPSVSLFEAIDLAEQGQGGITKGPLKKLVAFRNTMMVYQQSAEADMHPARLLERLLEDTGYLAALRLEGTREADDRVENLMELIAAIDENAELSENASLATFLEEVSLATDADIVNESTAEVVMMTLHAAKGLEFEVVMMPGLEEGLFPHSRSLNERAALEEERRLCYVGITRAKKHVHISAARMRTIFGQSQLTELSRFVAEIPSELLAFGAEGHARQSVDNAIYLGEEHNLHAMGEKSLPTSVQSSCAEYDFDQSASPGVSASTSGSPCLENNGYQQGMRVFHRSFGEGEILGTQGSGKKQKLTIAFPGHGEKVVVARWVEPVH